MKKKIMSLLVLFVLLIIPYSASATLTDNGDGTITDSESGLMWLANANVNGAQTWDVAMTWAEDLVLGGYDDWRLPYSDDCSGFNCASSEMGNLFYNEGITASNPDEFLDVQSSMYWSGTVTADPLWAWRFHFNYGNQLTSYIGFSRYAMAVRDIPEPPPVVPEPISSILFIAGAMVFGVTRVLMPKGDS